MSYILDALKKSEEKRNTLQRSSTATLVTPTSVSESNRFALPLMLLCLVFVLGWLLLQWQEPDQHEGIEVQHVIPVDRAVISNSISERVATVAMEQQSQASALEQGSVSAMPDKKETIIHIEQEQPVFTPLTPTSPLSRVKPTAQLTHHQGEPNMDQKNVKSVYDLPLAQQQSLPRIHIEGHIYDADPDVRMVIINGHVRREKQSISAELSLQEIIPDGVILNYQGRIFKLGVFDQ